MRAPLCLLSLLVLLSGIGVYCQTSVALPYVALNQTYFRIDSPAPIQGTYAAQPALFGPQPHPGDLIAQVLVAYPDPAACGDDINDFSYGLNMEDEHGVPYLGKLILILRGGGCTFDDKVLNAERVGAAGVIFYNFNYGQDTTVLMFTNFEVSIPCLFISGADGLAISNEINLPSTVMGRIPGTGGAMHPDDTAALLAIASDPVAEIHFDVWAGLNRGWHTLSEDGDGCGNRTYGVWCANGRVQAITVDFLDYWAGGMSEHFNDLPALTFLQLSLNFIEGALPCLNNLVNLQYLIINDNLFDTWPSAACLNAMTSLRHLWALSNSFTDFPQGVTWPKMEYFLIGNNQLAAEFGVDTSVPFGSGAHLLLLDYSSNPDLHGPMPSPTTWTRIQSLSFSGTGVSAPNVPANQLAGIFNNLPDLRTLNLRSAQYHSPVPLFVNTTSLTELDLSFNHFVGSLPVEWRFFSQLRVLNLGHNEILSPISSIRKLPQLAEIDISFNNLTTCCFGDDDDYWSVFVFRSVPISTEVLDLSNNQLTGEWTDGFSSIAVNLRRLSLGHNQLSGPLSPEMWKLPNPHFEAFDFSYNHLSGSIPSPGFYPTLQAFYVDHNPDMYYNDTTAPNPAKLPSWASPSSEFVFSGEQPYVCPTLTGTNTKTVFTVDPHYYDYEFCVCEKGRYGTAPDCELIPVAVDDTNRVFGDSAYGDSRRRSVGIDTSWVFVGEDMANNVTELHGNPLRVIYVALNYTADFNAETDAIDVHEGGADLKGRVVAAIRGTDADKPHRVPVFTPQATVNFRSRKESGTFFTGELAFSDVCPQGFSVSAITDQCEPGGLSEGDGLVIKEAGNLIVLAYVVSVVGGWTTFIINENVLFARSKGLNPIGWLLATGLTLGGASIWAWNGIAMPSLAFDHDVPIDFDVTISMACIVLPMGLTFIGLSIASLDPFLYPASKNGQKAMSVVSSMTRESQKDQASRADAGSVDGNNPQRQVSADPTDVEEEAQAKFKKAQARKSGGPMRDKLLVAFHQLNRYVFIGALFIGAAVVTTHWVWLTSFNMNAKRSYNYGNDLAAILVVYGICVPVTFIAFFFRGVMWNFVAAFLFAAAQICCFFIDIKGHTYTYALSAIYADNVTLDKNVVILIACAVAAIACFGFIGFNVIKLKVSRGALQYLLKKFKKEIQRMEMEIQRERHVNQRMLEKLQAQQHALDLITYCTPTLSEFSVATCLAGKVEARVSHGAHLKYMQATGALTPFLEQIRPKLTGPSDHLDPKLFSQISVPVLLSHPVTIELFKDEFVKHNAPETIMFWLNVQLYKKIKDNGEMVAFGREIVDKYISDKGDYQINISGSARNKLLEHAHSGHFDHKTFASVEMETVNLMSNQYLMQFRATPAFRLCAYILEEVALQEKAAKAAAVASKNNKDEEKTTVEKREGSFTVGSTNDRDRAVSTNQGGGGGHVGIEMGGGGGGGNSSATDNDTSRAEASSTQ